MAYMGSEYGPHNAHLQDRRRHGAVRKQVRQQRHAEVAHANVFGEPLHVHSLHALPRLRDGDFVEFDLGVGR